MRDDPSSPQRAPWLDLRPRGRRALEEEIGAELEEHVALCVEYLMARGDPREEAERAARARFGEFPTARRRLLKSARVREQRVRHRERWQDLGRDVALAFRLFRRSPRFTLAIVLTLALGVGANGAVFSIMQATLLQPLPYREPDRVVMLWRAPERPPPSSPGAPGTPPARYLLTRTNVEGLRAEAAWLEGFAVAVTWQGNLSAQFDLELPDQTRRLRGAQVSPNFFEVLGVRAAHGREFRSDDETAGVPLVVLSHTLWQREFGGDPAVIGRTIRLKTGRGARREPTAHTIIGVLPPAFRFTYPDETEAWALLPSSAVASYPPEAIAFLAVGRLGPGLTVEDGRVRAAAFRTGIDRPGEAPEFRQRLRLEPIREWVVGQTRSSMLLLGGVAGLLLLITCVTVANGLLVRVAERRRELAVRASLGAGRGRLIRQLVTEGMLLALAGVTAGTGLAILVQPSLEALLPSAFPLVGELGLDPSILGFAAVAATVSTVLAALAPALGATAGARPHQVLRASATTSAGRSTVRWRQGLVSAQAAVATMLIISGTLLLGSFWRLGGIPLGFDGEEVLTVEMRLLDPRYFSEDALRTFQTDVLTRVRAIPGVAEAGITTAVPFRGVDFTRGFSASPGAEREIPARVRTVDSGYFRVLRIPLRRGRLPSETDGADTPPVAVVSADYAQALFGAAEPIGRPLYDNGDPITVVGVVGEIRSERLERDPLPAVYFPRAQVPRELICIVLRTTGGPAGDLGPSVRAAIRAIDPGVPAMHLTTVDRIVEQSVAVRRFYTVGTIAFAALALLLTVVGLSVVVARAVAERRREMAIRAALGATRTRLARHASSGGLAAVGLGVAAGAFASLLSSGWLGQFLFQMPARSPAVFGGVALLITGVAGVAAWAASRGATGIVPVEALRAE